MLKLLFIYALGIGIGIFIGYDICLNNHINKLKGINKNE